MFRPLCTMPLPGLLSSKLRELGFMYCDDVCIDRNGKPILDPVAEKVLRQWSDEPCTYWKELLATPATKNAFSHLQDECDLGRIETFCRSLDEYMDGGVPLQRITEFSEIAEACVNHCSTLARDGLNQNMLQAMKHFSKISILENVFHVRLIVIDSITFPLQTIDNALQRVSLLYDLMENLRTIASEFDVAVVVTNNLTTKVETEKESSLIPALGESFGHSVNYRFLLGRMSDSNFVCVSGKNLNKSSLTVPFQITRSGIREVQNN
ncbi:DNA repair protein RAD51 3 [Gryllus bimaculatus]|nr:DNA repair protein RAD51 3 [Gryllus bimaculatus]